MNTPKSFFKYYQIIDMAVLKLKKCHCDEYIENLNFIVKLNFLSVDQHLLQSC